MSTEISVTLRNGFEQIIIGFAHSRENLPEFVLDEDGKPVRVDWNEGDVYRVTGTGLYATSHGFRAGDTRTFSFTCKEEARAKANGWFAYLVSRGYERVK